MAGHVVNSRYFYAVARTATGCQPRPSWIGCSAGVSVFAFALPDSKARSLRKNSQA
jgi:hypothetical protein